jgi:hypothetical protein
MTSKQLSLIHENNNFRIESDEGSFPIQRCYMDKELRGISSDKLAKYVAAGARLQVSKLDGNDHEYTLKLNGKLNGGGPITANALYWITKSVCWGGVGAAATAGAAGVAASVAATGGTAGLAIGAAVNAGASVIVAGTGAGTVAAGAAAAAIGTSAAATTTAVTITAATASAGGAIGVVTAIESASLGAFAFGLLLPLP